MRLSTSLLAHSQESGWSARPAISLGMICSGNSVLHFSLLEQVMIYRNSINIIHALHAGILKYACHWLGLKKLSLLIWLNNWRTAEPSDQLEDKPWYSGSWFVRCCSSLRPLCWCMSFLNSWVEWSNKVNSNSMLYAMDCGWYWMEWSCWFVKLLIHMLA